VLISGKVNFDAAAVSPVNRETVVRGWHPVQYPKSGPLIHGASFQCLKEIAFEREKAFGRILAQASEIIGGKRPGAWKIPIAELDACLVACGGYALKETGALALPRRFELLHIFRQPRDGEICEVQVLQRGRDESMIHFDFVLYGAEGTAILQAEGFCAAMVGRGREQ
jgi:hypothetical protein